MTDVSAENADQSPGHAIAPAEEPGDQAEEGRPGFIHRFAAGAWHLLSGMLFIGARPRLWLLSIAPACVGSALTILGALLGWYTLRAVEQTLLPSGSALPDWLGASLVVSLGLATIAGGAALGLAVALLLCAPLLDYLAARVVALLRGEQVSLGGLRQDSVRSVKGALVFAGAVLILLLLALTPILGPLVALLWGGYALAFQQTEPALARLGRTFTERRAWHREWRWEGLGFGVAGLVALTVPIVQLFVIPALAVGATLLVLEIEEGLTP